MKNVLILEDQELDRRILQEIIDELQQDCQVYECASCQEGYYMAMEHTIHLFLIDVMLEGNSDFSGFKFVQNIRQVEKYKEAPIIFISSVVGYELMAFKRMHCYDYITKPFQVAEIKLVIDNALNLKVMKQVEERIDFEVRGIYYPVETNCIRYIESNRRVIYIHTISDVLELPGKSLKECYALLNKDLFIQVHKSFIVSRNFIGKVELPQRLIYIKGSDGMEQIGIGTKYRDGLREWLNDS